MRQGYVVDVEEAATSLRKAIDQAQKSSGYKIEKAYFSIGGAGIEAVTASGSISLGEKETAVGPADLEAALEASLEALPSAAMRNRDIIHSIPLSYKIDGKQVFGKALGMTGTTLEVKALFITALSAHLSDLVSVAKLAGINIEDVDASPIVSSVPLAAGFLQ
jgi:cell division protein FtsA